MEDIEIPLRRWPFSLKEGESLQFTEGVTGVRGLVYNSPSGNHEDLGVEQKRLQAARPARR